GPNDTVAPGELAVDAADSLAIEAHHRAKLEIDVEVSVLSLALAVACYRRFQEAPTVEHVAAHGDLHDAVRTSLGLQGGLVPVGRRIGREVRVHQVAVLVDLERALDRGAAAIDDDILEARRLRLRHHDECSL